MKQKLLLLIKNNPLRHLRHITRPDVIAALIISVTVAGVTINTSSVIMQNYQLEREVRAMEQKVSVAQIELETQKAKNQYYATDYYLDIAARKQLSKGASGEKLIIVPKSVAVAKLPVKQETTIPDANIVDDQQSLSNIQKWRLFLSGDLN